MIDAYNLKAEGPSLTVLIDWLPCTKVVSVHRFYLLININKLNETEKKLIITWSGYFTHTDILLKNIINLVVNSLIINKY